MIRSRSARCLGVAALFAFSLAVSGCADDDGPRKELVVEQVFEVGFDGMSAGQAHSNVDNNDSGAILTDDLRLEPKYTALLPDFVCAGLDRTESRVVVDALDLPTGSSVGFLFSVDIREVGATQWTLLAQLQTDLSANSSFFLSEDVWTLNPTGNGMLGDIVLGDKPQYEVRFTGTADGAVTELKVQAHLFLKFTNRTGDCP